MKKAGRFLTIFILTIILISFLGGLVSAVYGNAPLTIPQSIKDFGNQWLKGTLDPGFAKVFMFLLVFLIVFLVLEATLSSVDKKILWGVSGIIAFLATAYIAPEAVSSVLISYSALGLTITTLIPLLFLFALTYLSATSKGDVGLDMTQYFAWGLYLAFILYKLIAGAFETVIYDRGIAYIVGGAAIAAFLMLIFNTKVRQFLTRRYISSLDDEAKKKFAKAMNMVDTLAQAEDTAANHEGE